MKVVLLEDVKSLGKKGDIVEVSEGYARNFIIPKKKGVEANQENLNTLKLQKANEGVGTTHIALLTAKELAAKLNEASVSLTIKGGKDGRTFGSVSSKEIEEAIKSQLGLEIDKKKLVIAEPIKTFGNHEVKVKLHKDVTAALKVKVGEE